MPLKCLDACCCPAVRKRCQVSFRLRTWKRWTVDMSRGSAAETLKAERHTAGLKAMSIYRKSVKLKRTQVNTSQLLAYNHDLLQCQHSRLECCCTSTSPVYE